MAQHRQVFCRFPQQVTLNLCLQLFSALAMLHYPIHSFLVLSHVYLAFPSLTNGHLSSWRTRAGLERVDSPTTTTNGPNISTAPNVTIDAIPGVWGSACEYGGKPPCWAYCRTRDTACQNAVRSVVRTCSPMWNSYFNIQSGRRSLESGWSTVTTVYGETGGPTTTTLWVWTSFSTASETFIRWNRWNVSEPTTMKPVYGLGSPVPSTSVTTFGPDLDTVTFLTATTPNCKFQSLTIIDPTACGQCTLYGGTVDLYYWPPSTATSIVATQTTLAASHQASSTILDGTTLYSPTVYISFHTAYASNGCSQVGSRHSGTLVAMKPEDVSTQADWGLNVFQSGAFLYGRLNYGDLTGDPPASEYEAQGSCAVYGCPTIHSLNWHPTLVVPSKLRSMDPAWKSCAIGLEGL